MNLDGKAIAFLGDSITEGYNVENVKNRFDNRIKEMCNLKEVYNYGIGGTRIAYQYPPSLDPKIDLFFCGRIYQINKDADIIVIFGGVNDYLHGNAPFGTMADKTADTFCGAVDKLMTSAKELFSSKTVVFLTPAGTSCISCGGDDTKPSLTHQTEDAKPLVEYVNVIKQKGKEFGFPVGDLHAEFKDKFRDYDFVSKYANDGLHFNDEGHKLLAEYIIEFLHNL